MVLQLLLRMRQAYNDGQKRNIKLHRRKIITFAYRATVTERLRSCFSFYSPVSITADNSHRSSWMGSIIVAFIGDCSASQITTHVCLCKFVEGKRKKRKAALCICCVALVLLCCATLLTHTVLQHRRPIYHLSGGQTAYLYIHIKG